jgi:hypothetical protein
MVAENAQSASKAAARGVFTRGFEHLQTYNRDEVLNWILTGNETSIHHHESGSKQDSCSGTKRVNRS